MSAEGPEHSDFNSDFMLLKEPLEMQSISSSCTNKHIAFTTEPIASPE